MCRGDHDSLGSAGRQFADHEALLVDRHVSDVDAHRQDCADCFVCLRAAVAGVFEGHAGHAALAGQGAQYQVDSLRKAGADDHPRGAGGGGSYPPQVTGEDLAQFGAAARVAVSQVRGGGLGARLLDGPGPVGTREAGQVRYAGLEVRDQRRFRGLAAWRGRRGRDQGRAGRGLVTGVLAADAGDPGGGPGAAGQVSLGQQLPVAVLHHAAGDAERTGQLPRGRQPFPGAEPAAPDRLAQARLQLGAQRLAGRTVEPDQQPRAQTGPLNRHEIGPYQGAGWVLPCVL